MKRSAVCAVVLSLLLAFTGCQKQSVEGGPAASTRGPVVSETTSSEEGTAAASSEESVEESSGFSIPSVPEISISQPDVSVAPKLDISNPLGTSTESETESTAESSEESKTESKSSPSNTTYDEVDEDGTFVYAGVTITLPKGYYVKTGSGTLTTVPADYPDTNQNVTFTKSEGTTEHITREQIDTMYKDVFDGFTGCKEFTEYTIDGYDAQYFTYDVSMSGVNLNMAQLAVYLDNRAVIITFTSEASEDFSVLKAAADSVRVD